MRRAEIGDHHQVASAYLRYAQEASWPEDNRRMSNGDQVHSVGALAMKRVASLISWGPGGGTSSIDR